jgi:hypothetical protein
MFMNIQLSRVPLSTPRRNLAIESTEILQKILDMVLRDTRCNDRNMA